MTGKWRIGVDPDTAMPTPGASTRAGVAKDGCRRGDQRRTLICHRGVRHHGLLYSFPVASLAVAVGCPARLGLLIALVRRPALLSADVHAASWAAVPLAAITATAKMENGPAGWIVALLLPERLVDARRGGPRHPRIMPSVRQKPKMIGLMIGTFGADDVAASGEMIKKIRFQMITDIRIQSHQIEPLGNPWHRLINP